MDRGTQNETTFLGRVAFRNDNRVFGITQKDRRSHLYAIGKTGTGKSTLLRVLIEQDVTRKNGFALLDPHGDLADSLNRYRLSRNAQDVVYVDVADPLLEWAFNPFAGIPESKRAMTVAGQVEVFKKIWPEDWGPRLEHVLRNVLYVLLDSPGSTLGDVPRILTNQTYRDRLRPLITNPEVRQFWSGEYAKYSPGFRAVVVAPLQNKVGALLTDPTLNRFLTGPGRQLNLRDIMDRGGSIIVNLDKGRIGEGPASILGSFLVSNIALAAMGRSDQPEETRRDFHVYLDEFHTFTTRSLAMMLSELRKYRVGLVLAHQHLSQLDPAIRDAVFGNVGTLISFRVGAADAQYLAREFAPTFSAEDLTSLPRYNMCLRLQIDGEQSKPFSAETLFGIAETI